MSGTNLKAVVSMLHRAERFDELPAPQQAALRAQVTRSLKTYDDPDILNVLRNIQDVIGVAAKSPAERMTADDLLSEYEASFAKYTARQKAAFKARVSRLGNMAENDGDSETVAAMNELSDRIVTEEEAGQRDLIRHLSDQLRKA